MEILEYMEMEGHQQLAVWTDPAVGLRSFIAIHNTKLGPALGGTRIWLHKSEDEAIMDVLRLSKAMTYKNALAGLAHGGGKGLIMADARTQKTKAMMESYGRFVESLGGRYITTEDVGASAEDMQWIARTTQYVVGLPRESGGSGNPSDQTGFGVFQAMRACALDLWGETNLSGKTVAIQGYGNVATALIQHLETEGCRVVVTDVDDTKRQLAKSRGIEVVEPESILSYECDIFAPCALGGVLSLESIKDLHCEIICGAANNQLKEPLVAQALQNAGILYAPDFLVNAGGVINVSYEIGQVYDPEAARIRTSRIFDTMSKVLAISNENKITATEAADQLANQKLEIARTEPK